MKSNLKKGVGDLGWIEDFGHSRAFAAGKVPVSPRIISRAYAARVPLSGTQPLKDAVGFRRGKGLEHDWLRLEPFSAEPGASATLLNGDFIVLMGRNSGQELYRPWRCRADLVEPQLSLIAETDLDGALARGHDHAEKVDCSFPGVIGATVAFDCPPPYSASSKVRFECLFRFFALILTKVEAVLFPAVKNGPIPRDAMLVAKVESWWKQARHGLVYESVRPIRQCWNSLCYQKLDHFLRPLPCTLGERPRAHLCQGNRLPKTSAFERISKQFGPVWFTTGELA